MSPPICSANFDRPCKMHAVSAFGFGCVVPPRPGSLELMTGRTSSPRTQMLLSNWAHEFDCFPSTKPEPGVRALYLGMRWKATESHPSS